MVSVTVNVALSAVISPVSWAMDVGQSKTFRLLLAGGSGTYTGYQWYVGRFGQNEQTASTLSFAPSSVGSHSIT